MRSISAFCCAASACRRLLCRGARSPGRCPSSASAPPGRPASRRMAALSLAMIVLRRALRRPDAVPERRRGCPGTPASSMRRHVRRRPPALRRQHREGLELAAAHLGQIVRGLAERDVDLAGRAGPASAARRRDRARTGIACRSAAGTTARRFASVRRRRPSRRLPCCPAALSQAINSFMSLAGRVLRAIIHCGVSAISDTGSKSFTTS